MCLVLDACTFAAFFDRSNKDHSEFEPALHWVVYREGKLVYGGKKYKEEIKKTPRYIRFFAALDRANKLVKLCDKSVNNFQDQVRDIEPSEKFDDPHLVAIVLASNCRIVCTQDSRAIPFLKDRRFYSGPTKKPKIYGSKRNADLLSDKYISDICRPCQKLGKKVAEKLMSP